jgi:hypothetical protein
MPSTTPQRGRQHASRRRATHLLAIGSRTDGGSKQDPRPTLVAPPHGRPNSTMRSRAKGATARPGAAAPASARRTSPAPSPTTKQHLAPGPLPPRSRPAAVAARKTSMLRSLAAVTPLCRPCRPYSTQPHTGSQSCMANTKKVFYTYMQGSD